MNEVLTESYDDILSEDLQDDEYAREYLNRALKDESDPRHFLLALSRVSKARKIRITDLARHLGIQRQALYHAFSDKGNPGWNTMFSLLHHMGYDIELVPMKAG